MPVKNSDKDSTPAVTLRRSPRILQIKLSDPEDPRTPKPQQQRRTRAPSSATPLTLTAKRNVSPRRRSHRSKSKECLQKLDGSCKSRQSDNSKTESRRSTRLNPCADACNAENSRSSSRRNGQLERRVTRSSCCRDVDKNAEKTSGFTGNLGNVCSSGEQITEEGVDIPTPLKCKSLKNKVDQYKKSCDNNSDQIEVLASDDDTYEGILSIKPVLDEELSEKGVAKSTNGIAVATAAVVHESPMEGRYVNKMRKNVAVKRTRNQFENMVGATHGWTKDQELALERAYLEAKPTPHFWKKVSRLVPGKSAQECFDKIHGSHLTPPQPRPRSRPRVSDSQNPSFTASKLLNSSSPTAKRPRHRRQKSHVVQRNVRHMLQKQHKVEQDSEADLFSVLEPTFTQSLNSYVMLTTPDCNQEMGEMLGRCQERSSTVHKKSLSRLGTRTTLMSPPVLKQAEKLHQSKLMEQESSAQRKDAIRAAKNALVFDARDAINEFQHHQAMALSFDDENGADVDEENGEAFM
ncbi:uncharacterized protein LOC112507528 [Cynara cardunculus var. scolymus]|uniref:uncharacterized protein LOC112507528 n=1 Tax=Cynara cardunculus var. scolymus TaxID=59895 RepID=UPI000D6271B6|nr:uncharacterized protein LOC112507528 [Cynara cardunculus var. scolymus]